MVDYPWYTKIGRGEPLAQGDIFYQVPFTAPPRDPRIYEADIEEYDVIVMSQSCDLEHHKLSNVLFCPIYPLEDTIGKIAGSDGERAQINEKNKLRKGEKIAYHLLNKCEIAEAEFDFKIVDLKNTLSLPLEFIVIYGLENNERIRLCPPYLEQLSQAFARVFMRVGLPNDIPKFE
jgi:hypothetical protein